MNTQKKGMTGKDIITVGIFSAIYFVINFAFMLLSGLHPLLWILMPGLIAIFAGIPFLMMCAKVPKTGAVLLMGFITALIYFVIAGRDLCLQPGIHHLDIHTAFGELAAFKVHPFHILQDRKNDAGNIQIVDTPVAVAKECPGGAANSAD